MACDCSFGWSTGPELQLCIGSTELAASLSPGVHVLVGLLSCRHAGLFHSRTDTGSVGRQSLHCCAGCYSTLPAYYTTVHIVRCSVALLSTHGVLFDAVHSSLPHVCLQM